MNEEAAVLMQEDFEAYGKRAKLMTKVHAMAGEVDEGEASSEAAAKVAKVGGEKDGAAKKKKKKKLTDRL